MSQRVTSRMSESSLSFNFGGVDGECTDYDRARILIWPIPFEATTTYVKGTAQGPRAIIEASHHLELYDEELEGEVYRLGIHTLPPARVTGSIDEVMNHLYQQTRRWLASGKFLCTLGGEHSISVPIVAAFAQHYPDLTVLQIDAHADLRSSYEGTPYNHACVTARMVEHCPVVQVGVRSLSREEARALPRLPVTIFFAKDIVGRRDWIEAVIARLSPHVYLTIDVDGLDPSLIPATGTPEPGGLSWYETLALVRQVVEKRTIVGMDVTELCPLPGHAASSFTVAKLIYKCLGYVFARDLPGDDTTSL